MSTILWAGTEHEHYLPHIGVKLDLANHEGFTLHTLQECSTKSAFICLPDHSVLMANYTLFHTLYVNLALAAK